MFFSIFIAILSIKILQLIDQTINDKIIILNQLDINNTENINIQIFKILFLIHLYNFLLSVKN